MSSNLPRWSSAIKHAIWEVESQKSLELLPADLFRIMSDKGSLTTALRNISNDSFQVAVIREELGNPFLSEMTKIGLSERDEATIREVLLKIYDEPVVYARSVIPAELTKKTKTGLASLGSKPLGHLLFKNGNMKNSRREFTCVQGVFGRRTSYEYEGSKILVNEFFLDSLKPYLEK